MDRQVKVLENQDKKTDRNHLKVAISEMKPAVKVVTAAQVKADIAAQTKEIENLQAEIIRCKNSISDMENLLVEIENAIV